MCQSVPLCSPNLPQVPASRSVNAMVVKRSRGSFSLPSLEVILRRGHACPIDKIVKMSYQSSCSHVRHVPDRIAFISEVTSSTPSNQQRLNKIAK